jgi:hypothetical protein
MAIVLGQVGVHPKGISGYHQEGRRDRIAGPLSETDHQDPSDAEQRDRNKR